MSILTGSEIKKEIEKGNIEISNFNTSQLNPNSYNLKLSNDIYRYTGDLILSTLKENELRKLKFKEKGKDKKEIMLIPGILYLATTEETTYTENFVPCIDGRSSIGRLGINVHITAGFGDIGYKGPWTLEISVIHPVNISAGIQIAQIYFHTIKGENDIKYKGKYQGGKILQSKIHEDKILKDIENIY